MTEKRFKHLLNAIGMQFICYDDKEILMGTFADADGVAHIVEILNELHEENHSLKFQLDECRNNKLFSRRQLEKENEQLKDAIIGKIQYGEDLEKFAIEKGLIQEDWARFDDYD